MNKIKRPKNLNWKRRTRGLFWVWGNDTEPYSVDTENSICTCHSWAYGNCKKTNGIKNCKHIRQMQKISKEYETRFNELIKESWLKEIINERNKYRLMELYYLGFKSGVEYEKK